MASHGTRSAYRGGCKCDACRGWKRQQDRDQRARLKRLLRERPDLVPHGTERAYSKYSCRCEPCKAAYRASRKRLKERNPRVFADANARWRARHPSAPSQYEAERDAASGPHSHAGSLWTGPELELVVVRSDLSDLELARMLGRSPRAVACARYRALNDPKYIEFAGVAARHALFAAVQHGGLTDPLSKGARA